MNDLEKWKSAPMMRVRAWAIDPFNLDNVRCEIPDVADCNVTFGYYSDNRASASLSVLDPDFPLNSWIRITAEDEFGGVEEMGTFAMFDRQTRTEREVVVDDYDLYSSIWAISDDRRGRHYAIAGNTKASTAIVAACEDCGRPYVFLPGFNDYTSGEAVTYEIDDAYSSILFDICDRSNNRMDVDGHGRLTFGGYVPPSARAADWMLDERDKRSIIVSTGRTVSSPLGEAYSRSIVTWKGRDEGDDEDREVIGVADVERTHPASPTWRGYTRAIVHSESEMSPTTADRATQLARQRLVDDSSSHRTTEVTVMWCPIKVGDIVQLVDNGGESSKWLVQTADCDLVKWEKKLTLKEAS